MSNLNDLPFESIPIGDFAERAYLAYAITVVKDRAIPMIQDGQKPVQKRLLWGMWDAGQKPEAKHVKSARVVGDVLGKYHPHGDTSVYDALVRLTQGFTVRYPLLHGQGNFGSLDGDSPAAMRYTEVRLAPIAELLLSEVGRGTVDFSDNYDGSFCEPAVLPARLPFALLNGASGIAVGMACDLPPHNLREVAAACIEILRNPNISLDDLMKVMPAPDFPGGGVLISSPEDIRTVYATGSGSLRIRARHEFEDLAQDQWQLVVTEFPPGCSAKCVMEELDALADPKVRDAKKDKLKPSQVATKQLVHSIIDTARDESDKSVPVRLVIEPKHSKVRREELLAFLFANTSLESSVKVNLTLIGLDGNPGRTGLQQMLTDWAAFRTQTVKRRCTHRLGEVDRRLHILAGRSIVMLHLDEVIAVIKESDEPRRALCDRFGLTEVQADDILEIRLRQLARLEWIKIESEQRNLSAEKSELERLLGDPEALRDQIIKEIESDAARFGDVRRTDLMPSSGDAEVLAVPLVVDEPLTVVLSKNGWIRARIGHGIDSGQMAFKPGDALLGAIETRTVYPVILIDSNGRSYSIPAADLPTGRGDGVPITSLIDLQNGGRIMHILSGETDRRYLFAGDKGYGFTTALKNLISRQRAGKAFLTLEAGEIPLTPYPVPAGTDDLLVACGSSAGRFMVFPFNSLKDLDKGKGLKLASLDAAARLVFMTLFRGDAINLEINIKGRKMAYKLAGDELSRHRVNRGAKGCYLPKKGVVTGCTS